MRNTYELEVRAACPVHDGLIDMYRVTVRSSATIQVETILQFFAPFQKQKIFQEELTAKAATALGAQVETGALVADSGARRTSGATMTYTYQCDCGYSETFYSQEPREDAYCSNCGDLVKVTQ